MKIVCIYNPKAGGGSAKKQLPKIKDLFNRYNIDAEIIFSKYPHNATEIIKELDLSKYEALVAAGGDGSFFDIVNGYMKHRNGIEIPLGIIPVGTGNSLSRDITDNLDDFENFIKIIAQKNTKKFDIGRVDTKSKTFYFANMMGFGFTTDVTLTASKLKMFGSFAYTLGVLYNTIKLKTYPLKMTIDDKEYDLENTFITVSNSKYTGGNYLIAPKAVVDDGKIDVIIVNKIGRINLLKTFPKIFDGSYINSPFVDYIQAEKVKFEAIHEKIVSPDGEICGELPIKIETISKAINILIDKDFEKN
jgi:YegS/Rv2252/BmrU family lipid kinase